MTVAQTLNPKNVPLGLPHFEQSDRKFHLCLFTVLDLDLWNIAESCFDLLGSDVECPQVALVILI